MKNLLKIFTLVLLVLSFVTVLGACNDDQKEDETPSGDINDGGNSGDDDVVDTKSYNITIESPENGKLTVSTKTAKSGETVTVTADADLGYKLEEGSLKANDTVITNGSFVMPAEDVIISAKFIVDGEKLTVNNTNLEFSAKSEGKDAKAHLSTVFGDNALVVKFVVEDEKLFSENGKSDGVKLYISKNTKSESYLANETYLVEVLINGEMKVSKFNGTEFASDEAAITNELSWFANQNGKLAGYIVELNVPYSLWNLTKEEAKGTLTICPAVLNKNSKTASFAVVEGYPKTFGLDHENHNSFIVLEDNDTYSENVNLYPGYYFKNSGDVVANGQYWNVDADTEENSGVVVLTGHDGMDNNLVFNIPTADFMYAKTTMKITDYYLEGDRYLKAGLALFDGQANRGVFYFADLWADEPATAVTDIKGNGYGYLSMDGMQFAESDYHFFASQAKFNLSTLETTLEIVYMDGMLYFLSNGELVHSQKYTPVSSDLRLGVKDFGFGLELTNYYCTTDIADSKISDTLSVINKLTDDSIWTEEVLANKIELRQPGDGVLIDFYAVKGADGVYIMANYQTRVLHTVGDWWQQDNLEMRFNGPEGKIKSSSTDEQWRLSTNGEANFTQASVSDAVLNSETGYYTIVFKAFVSYERLGITATTPLGFTMGSNPGGVGPGNGWMETEYFSTNDLTAVNKITEKGILRYCLEDTCPHKFGQYTIISNATCSENGLKEAHCIYCNKVDSVVIESTGEHVYDEENVTINRASTCTEHGIGIIACGCGDTKEIELPLDLSNHEGHWNSQTNTCDCGSVVNNAMIDYTGRESFNHFRYELDGSKDFEFAVLLTQERAAGSTDWGDGFIAEVFSEGWWNGGWSYRTDWHGWGSWADPKGVNATYTDVNNGLWIGRFPEASAVMDIIYNLKYDASENTIIITMTYISKVDEFSSEVKELTYVCNNVMYKGKMVVAFGAKNAQNTNPVNDIDTVNIYFNA